MGSQISAGPADQEHDADEETTPLFEKIKIVLIGYHESGKNTIGNTILRKKVFTSWNTHRGHYSKSDNTIFGRRIHLVRVPGWSEDLSSDDIKQMKLRQVIKDSVKSFKHGPHVIILVVRNNSKLTRTTRCTLEELLTESFSKHTLVFSMDGERLLFAEMKDHCESAKETVINICRNRYHLLKKCPCGKQNMELIEVIEDFIARKDPLHFFPMENETPNPELQIKQLEALVNGLNKRISALSESVSKLQSESQTDGEVNTKLQLKNEKINELNGLLTEKERVLERLRSSLSPAKPSVLHGTETQSKDEANDPKNKHQIKTQKRKKVKKRNTDAHKEETLKYRSHLEGKEEPDIQTNNTWRRRPTNSQDISSEDEGLAASDAYIESSSDFEGPQASELHRGPHNQQHSGFLRDWTLKLNNVMNELTGPQFKRMTDLMQFRDEWRIPAGLLDGQDRASVTKLLIQTWGEHQCIINTRDIMKEIPRNDSVIRDLFMPYLEHIGQTW